jgi:hypothetical protein
VSGEQPNVTFPEGFEDLEAYSEWVLWTDEERVHKQVTTSVDDLAVFYRGMLPRAGAIYDHLATVPLDKPMSDEDHTLLCLAAAFGEIADGVEYYSPESTAADAMPRFISLHDSLFGWRGARPTEGTSGR